MSDRANEQRSRSKLDWEFEEFLVDRCARNYTDATLKWYRRCLGKWSEFCVKEGIETTHEVTASHVRRYLIILGEQHTKGGVATLFTGLRAYLNWFKDEYAPVEWAPLARIKAPKRPKERVEPLSLEHFKKLIAQTKRRSFAGDRDRAVLHLLLDTGIRHQELTDLNVGDVNLTTGQVIIRRGKGQKSRVVFIGAKCRRLLIAYFRHRAHLEDHSPLWINRDGVRMTGSGLRQIVRRLAQKAGIPEPGMHSFRRAFAVNSLRNGMDVLMLQRLMGHADLSVLDRYLALVDDDLRDAHSRFGVVDHL